MNRLGAQHTGLWVGLVFGLITLSAASSFVSAQDLLRRPVGSAAPEYYTHHSLRVILNPENGTISVEDTITLPPDFTGGFHLNTNLTVTGNSGTVQLLPSFAADDVQHVGINSTGGEMADTRAYAVTLPASAENRLVLGYTGSIHDPAEQTGTEYAQSFSESAGIIDRQGVYLAGSSVWLPNFGTGLITFDMQVEFAGGFSGWTAVSQGDRQSANTWRSEQPMEEVYLIAADFTEYAAQHDDIELLVYLRQPEPNLAGKYLDATQRYLALYEPLLGEYPYGKFALIENFWETGYGMPSFTLLGQQVIRFPFIINSSYPHEILHNWWGNGVYPDYESGNWSEGLTAYLADHLFREMDGLGHEYRKDMLVRYRNYVTDAADFPLTRFTSRNSAATQAVGYGKSLMLWHMLRVEVGDELFLEGLRRFYGDYRFQRASFEDIERVFSRVSGRDLSPFFAQWVERTGAPQLEVSVDALGGNRARINFAQIQGAEAYEFTVPVALYYDSTAHAGAENPLIYNVALSQKFEAVIADDYQRLQAVVVDPYFDVFRRLHHEELSSTIGQLFGATSISFILPTENRQQWRQLAEAFAAGIEAEMLNAEDITGIPQDRAVWVLGRNNPFARTVIESAAPYGANMAAEGVLLPGGLVEHEGRSTVLTAKHPADPELAIGWIGVDEMVAMPGMIEKLPHYGKYSYLSFYGPEPTNDLSGIWNSPESPMQWFNPDLQSPAQLPPLPPTEPIATLPPKYLPANLQRHAAALTRSEMQGRGIGSAGFNLAANAIADRFREAGLVPPGGSYVQSWTETFQGAPHTVSNVIGLLPGSDRSLGARPLVIGAHFDHLGVDESTGRAYPGADDNASGVSVLIEVASRLNRTFAPRRPVLFVAFGGEESGLLGSSRFLENPPRGYDSNELFAMINLDSVGRLQGRPIQIFGSDSAYEWPFMAQGIGFTTGIESSFATETIASGDHVNFLNQGIPAIHLFSGVHPDYHRVSDTVDKLDLDGMSAVAAWLEEAIIYLAEREEPLRVTLNGAQVSVNTGQGEREASLGTVPDFGYDGEGVRIAGVTPGSGAQRAGLEEGDILLTYNGAMLRDLQTYSNLLRSSSPEDEVTIELRRGSNNLKIQVTLGTR
ncbi:MAG: M20/M25/M40 family metallo-hydrolase [Pseudohongiellaceae bacterium]